jgi:hypothetical protein
VRRPGGALAIRAISRTLLLKSSATKRRQAAAGQSGARPHSKELTDFKELPVIRGDTSTLIVIVDLQLFGFEAVDRAAMHQDDRGPRNGND